MSYTAQNSAMRSRFATNWTTTAIKYDNADLTPPANTAFVVFEIHDADETPISMGNAILYRNYGIISINVHVPLNTGTKILDQYCDAIALIFRGQQFSGINCRGARKTRLGEIDGRFVANVSIEFHRDEEF